MMRSLTTIPKLERNKQQFIRKKISMKIRGRSRILLQLPWMGVLDVPIWNLRNSIENQYLSRKAIGDL